MRKNRAFFFAPYQGTARTKWRIHSKQLSRMFFSVSHKLTLTIRSENQAQGRYGPRLR
jgi:hypothetical protein